MQVAKAEAGSTVGHNKSKSEDVIAENRQAEETVETEVASNSRDDQKPADEQVTEATNAVELPEIHRTEIPSLLQEDVAGMREMLKRFAVELAPGKCESLPQTEKVRVLLASVISESAYLKAQFDLNWSNEAVRQIRTLRVVADCLPTSDKCQKLQLKLYCTRGSEVSKC